MPWFTLLLGLWFERAMTTAFWVIYFLKLFFAVACWLWWTTSAIDEIPKLSKFNTVRWLAGLATEAMVWRTQSWVNPDTVANYLSRAFEGLAGGWFGNSM